MNSPLDIPLQAFFGQLLIGLINGSFYALLSLGLAVIFGMLRVINFAHGAQYMLGAFCAWLLLRHFSADYWTALLLAPLLVGALGALKERVFLAPLYRLDHLYGLLLTYGVSLVIEGLFRHWYGTAGESYPMPAVFSGAVNLGFMVLPLYRGWVIVASILICSATWALIERTKFGAYLRAATENPVLVQSFGVNVPRIMMLTYAIGAGLAALSGVLAAPIYPVNPLMGRDLMVVVFAVVVIGGMGSILGAVVAGYALGLLEGLTKVFYPEASSTIVFVTMAIVLLIRPAGLFGKDMAAPPESALHRPVELLEWRRWSAPVLAIGVVLLLAAPHFVYPILVMKVLCFALFAAAFNLLFGYVGLLSFGHAAFFGGASYITAYTIKELGVTPELGILAGAAFASVLGVAFGYLAIRRLGIYFAMITLALAQMFFFFSVQAPFTGGENGIQDVPRGNLFGLISLDSGFSLYYFVMAIFLFGFIFVWRIVRSPFGNILKAIRENEQRAISLGYKVDRYKLGAFVMSAGIAGLAGATKAIVFQSATLTDVGWQMSGEVILMTLLGGIGTLLGPVAGAALVVALESWVSELAVPAPIIMGTIFIVCVMIFRRGIVGEASRLLQMPTKFPGWGKLYAGLIRSKGTHA
ncbi:MAG: branched-chain amino acid ABC transporter permease [Acidobacteria bacterium RIFCSPLOWO2_02_FULL_59_13]|nr:MAG: branched-chain amino acid ABC transporter permease [Acidobacteria bacterium RIFCSPLOWO2_02_FULL_59_13]